MQIAQQMHPTALLAGRLAVVTTIEVADQHLGRHLATAARTVHVIARRPRPLGAETPGVAVLTIFSPARLIAIDDGAAPDLLLELGDYRIQGRSYASREKATACRLWL